MAGKRSGWLKNSVKSTYDLGGWFGRGYIGNGSRAILGTFRAVFSAKNHGESFEHFDQAVQHYGLSHQDLAEKLKGFTLQVRIYLVMLILAIIYMLYLFIDGKLFPGLIMVPVSALAAVKVAQAKFYCFQLKHRKLVPSLAVWWGGATKEKKNEK